MNAASLKKFALGAVAAASFAVALAPLAAQAGEVSNRIGDQQARIAQGVRDGQLTRGEFDRTEGDLARINAQRRADLRANGGTLTPAERGQLNRELNRNSERIYFEKHNLNRQPGAPRV
jgi:hypothetical protein